MKAHLSVEPAARHRRRRSIRVATAIGLVALGTVLVLGTVAAGSHGALTVGALGAVLCSWAALRIVWTELGQTQQRLTRERLTALREAADEAARREAEQVQVTEALARTLRDREDQAADLRAAYALARRTPGGPSERPGSSGVDAASLPQSSRDRDTGPQGTVTDLHGWDERVKGSLRERRGA